VMDAEVDNMGNAFVLLKSDLGERMEGKPNMEIALHRLADGDISQVSIPLGSGFVVGAMLRALENDRMACAGIYASSEGGTITAGGNFLAVFDSTSTTLGEPVLMPFSGEKSFTFEGDPGELDDEKEGKGGAEEGKKMKRIAVNDDVIAMLPRKDGGFFLVNEVNVIEEQRDAETGRVSQSFHFGPVQARSFDKEGHEQWSTFFRRWSSSDSPLLGRVFCVDFDNKLFLFLIDTEEMTEHRKSGAPITVKDTQKPFSAYVSFDEKGAFKAKPVLRGESGSDFIAGSELVRLGANEYIALGTDNLISSHFLPVKIEISFETKK
ncbi:MAG TPA: hypothetical protein VKG92_02635, partial [Flavobacteriales bacterium]|nr:hypothetical protein [Flavobacteriales bacterium]